MANKKKRARINNNNKSDSTSEVSETAQPQRGITDYFKTNSNNNTVIHAINDTHKNTEKLLEELNGLKQNFNELKENFFTLKNENNVLRTENINLRNKLNDLEQYGRRLNVRIFGMKEEVDETIQKLEEKVTNIFVRNLGLSDFKGGHAIDVLHRVGKPGRTKRPRAVIVRFQQRRYQSLVLSNRKKLKGLGISISEDLTASNAKLLKQCRNSVEFCEAWSRNGVIFGKKENGTVIKVKTNYDESTPQAKISALDDPIHPTSMSADNNNNKNNDDNNGRYVNTPRRVKYTFNNAPRPTNATSRQLQKTYTSDHNIVDPEISAVVRTSPTACSTPMNVATTNATFNAPVDDGPDPSF